VHVTGNYAYDCSRMSGPGLGTASAMRGRFVDPMFSSGVFLAMNSAEQAVPPSTRRCAQPAREAELMRGLERR
jgi:hypothetical protein